MSAAAPWSVKGIDPKAREIAKDLARRSGMTLGDWLNSMILEDDDDGVIPLPRRSHAAETHERRGRSRRLDDAYGDDQELWQRLAASVDAIAGRLEAAERRSTIAIQGVDQAVNGLVRRLDGQEKQDSVVLRRIETLSDELKEGHRRLRRFEQETGPATAESFGKVETTLGALASRLYDIEERQRAGVNELRQRMDAVEAVAKAQPAPGLSAEVLSHVGARLDSAQAQTTEALRSLERSFAGLDQRLRATEGRVEPEGAREAARFEKLAETLARQVDANRTEMMRRLDTAETEGRIDRIERAVLSIGDQIKASERRGAQAVEAMGREVLRIAQNLNGRMKTVEADGATRMAQLSGELAGKIDREIGRLSQGLDQRLISADDRHALAIEKLGGEITRISDRLSDRIAQSERKSAQALDEIGKKLAEGSERIEQRYDRASGELAERMRLSEERTARLLAEAKESLERRAEAATVRDAPLDGPLAVPAAPINPAAAPAQADWRAAAFPGESFDDGWSDDGMGLEAPVPIEQEPAPFPTAFPAAAAAPPPQIVHPAPVPPAFDPAETPATPQPFGSRTRFGGADVSDALAATRPDAFDSQPFDAGIDDYAAETDFVDERTLRAAATAGRAASSTRQTIDAARAAMAPAAPEEAPRSGFGLKKGGKSKLQERLDRQARKEGSTVRKALGASAVAAVLTSGAYAYAELTGQSLPFPGLDEPAPGSAQPTPIAALAIAPAEAVPAGEAEGLFIQALEQLDAGNTAGLADLERAAELGHVPAQLHLAGLYQTGDSGVPTDAVASRRWARRAAESGDAKGMHAYGMYLFDGVGGPRNRAEAMTWLLKAANLGLIDSQYNVARLYENGDEGIPINRTDALRWYLIAARSGDPDAQEAVTRLTPQTPAAAQRSARAAAEAFTVEPLA
ncbi:hypothetical protein [Brevundimonas vitis]|uniref:hypothetical protein n=1 Tax=Brevundimonas vitisensis TaxID=2800818 RepID=UPI001E5833F2|nr:hypothetical protein [Brevundimonas vitisensis]